jgi:hypothetical protein
MIGVEHEARLIELAALLHRHRAELVDAAVALHVTPEAYRLHDGTYPLTAVTIAQTQVEIALLQLTLHRDVAERELCACESVTISTGTGVEHDVDTSACPVHGG